MDGNESLKRVMLKGDRQVGDKREFKSSTYYLSDHFVDRFAHEVKSRNKPAEPSIVNRNSEEPTITPGEGDPTDGTPELNERVKICVNNWKAAKEESTKRSWEIFDETGIFASACRHGLIPWIVDMRRSGELRAR